MENGDGTLSIFGTVVDVDAPVRAPALWHLGRGFRGPRACLRRPARWPTTIPRREGWPAATARATAQPRDRNVELVVSDPRRSTASGRCGAARGRFRGLVGGQRAARAHPPRQPAGVPAPQPQPPAPNRRPLLPGRAARHAGSATRRGRFRARMSRRDGRAFAAARSRRSPRIRRTRSGGSAPGPRWAPCGGGSAASGASRWAQHVVPRTRQPRAPRLQDLPQQGARGWPGRPAPHEQSRAGAPVPTRLPLIRVAASRSRCSRGSICRTVVTPR